MTLFAFLCRDAAGGASLRERLLKDHLAYIETVMANIAVAGPLKEGDTTVGSLLIIKAETEEEARATFEGDPYFANGVWKSIEVNHFLGVAGDWVGGTAWRN